MTQVDQIIDEVFRLDSPRVDISRRDEVHAFIASAINGDTTVRAHLVINANLGPNRSGALIYILTNLRLIKIDIDEKNLQSKSPSLSSLINVSRKTDGGKVSIALTFQDEFFGLTYPATQQRITDFFQEVDRSRIQGAA